MDLLIRKIENEYGFDVDDVTMIKDKPRFSFVAKIKTSDGKEFAVKSLYLDEQRQRFIVESEKLLSKKGLKIAKPVRTTRKKPYVMYDDFPYVLYKWIEGSPHPVKNTEDFLSLIKTAARLHHSSKGLKFPRGIKIYSNKDWHKEYILRLQSLNSWYQAHQSSDDEKVKYLLQWVPYFTKHGERALDLLKKSNYQSVVSRPAKKKTLVHGDMHRNNVMVNDKKKIVLFDFEDVRYDIPSKDLLRIYSMYLKKKTFSDEIFDRSMKEYKKIHSISSKTENLIYLDFYFPNTIEHMIRKKRYERFDLEKLEHYIHQEMNKTELMKLRLSYPNPTGPR